MSTDIRWIEENAETTAIAAAAVRLHSMLGDNYSERGCLHLARQALKAAAAARPVPQAGEVENISTWLRTIVGGDAVKAADLLTAQAAEIAKLNSREALANVALSEENDALIERIAELQAALRRVTDCLDTFIRETEDPGTEALAAVYCARAALAPAGKEVKP